MLPDDDIATQTMDTVLGALSGATAWRLLAYVLGSLGTPQNEYQVAVGSHTAASIITPALEALVDRGLLSATGDKDSPNERLYWVLPRP